MVFLDRHDSCLYEVYIPVGEKGEKKPQNTIEAVIIVLKETTSVMGK